MEQARTEFDMMGPNENDLVSFDSFSKWFLARLDKEAALSAAESSVSKKRPAGSSPPTESSASKKAKAAAGQSAPAPPATASSTPKAPGSASETPLPAGKKVAMLKQMVAALKNSIKEKKFYNFGSLHDCSAEGIMTEAEFAALFGSLGTPKAPKTKTDARGAIKIVKSILVERNLTAAQVAGLFVDAKGASLLGGIKVATFG